MTHFFMYAGELSGDMYGTLLIRELKRHIPNLKVTGVPGPEMRSEGVTGPLRMENFEVMGFSDVLRSLPKLRRHFHTLKNYILDTTPEMAIFIDSPSMSIRLAKALRRKGYKGKIVQYICPTVWAWGKHRIKQMAENFDLLLTIFPFEESYFKNSLLKTVYIGNPLKELISQHHYDENWSKLLGIKDVKNLIALFPGSRPGEIKRNLPKLLAAAKRVKDQNTHFSLAVSCANDAHMALIQEIIAGSEVSLNKDIFVVPRIYTYDLMKFSKSAIAKSGTITLELALHHCPTVVVYELTKLNRFIAKFFLRLRLPHYCIVNILTGKTVFPELIEKGFTIEMAHEQLQKLLLDQPYREACIGCCKELHSFLQEENASERASKEIINVLGF